MNKANKHRAIAESILSIGGDGELLYQCDNPEQGEIVEIIDWLFAEAISFCEGGTRSRIVDKKEKDELIGLLASIAWHCVLFEAVESKKKKEDIFAELSDVYVRKNRDYGDSFGQTYCSLGVISALTRLSDKHNRMLSLFYTGNENRLVDDERLQDTMLDMANYCIMTIIELEV